MQRSRPMHVMIAVTLAFLVGLAGWVVMAETSACDGDACDEGPADDSPCAVCVCCLQAPRAIATSDAFGPGVMPVRSMPRSLGHPFADPPPEDILHVPRRLSSSRS